MNKRIIIFCTAGSVIALLFLWEQVQVTRLGYEVSRTHIELNKKRDRTAYLRMELDQLHSPDLLAARARNRLGMSPANPERILFLGNTVPRSLSGSQDIDRGLSRGSAASEALRAAARSPEKGIGPIASLMGR